MGEVVGHSDGAGFALRVVCDAGAWAHGGCRRKRAALCNLLLKISL